MTKLKKALIEVIEEEKRKLEKMTHKEDLIKLEKNYKKTLETLDDFIEDIETDINSSLGE